MKLIERHDYLDRLKRLRGTPDIKIITGMRRSGKSELLRSFSKHLKALDSHINIITIDFNNLLYEELKDYKSLFQYVEEHYVENTENVLIVDEVQLCPKFELAINSFHNSKKYDIYITGSNAFLLSSDLATLFTGRFIEISVYPFSFSEYCSYFEIKEKQGDYLQTYLKEGGLAGSYLYPDNSDAMQYIRDVYYTLVKRDLVDKYKIKEVALLDTVAEYLMDNIANLTTSSVISNKLKQSNFQTNHVTVGNFLKYLCNAFLFYKVKRYDIRGKRYLETNDKYYVVDLSLRYAMLGTRNMDYGRAFENIVALELLRRGYDIYVGKLYEKEVDFVAMKDTEKLYIQVSDSIADGTTLERELSPLRTIRDAYPKILIANTRHEVYDIEGIKVIDISEWLLQSF